MFWAKDSDDHFIEPNRSPDFMHKGDRYWFKEMIANKGSIVSPVMACPVSGDVMVYRCPNGWYTLGDVVRRQYEIWITDNILLGDAE